MHECTNKGNKHACERLGGMVPLFPLEMVGLAILFVCTGPLSRWKRELSRGQISKYFLFLIAVGIVFGLWGQRARTAGLHPV